MDVPTAGHRADYILERGVWRATCRKCGWKVTDRSRRQAASIFRQHCHDLRPEPEAVESLDRHLSILSGSAELAD